MPHTESPTAEVLRNGIPVRNRELVIERPDGTRVPVLSNVVPLRNADGSLIGAVSCLQDITERKRTEQRLQESNEKLQLMSRRLVESQETERRHIARELHDEVGQTLTVAEMNLQAMVQSSRTAPLTRRLKESLQAVERVLAQVRDLSLNLRPSMLDDLGLESALTLVYQPPGGAERAAGRLPSRRVGEPPRSGYRNRLLPRGPGSAYQRRAARPRPAP